MALGQWVSKCGLLYVSPLILVIGGALTSCSRDHEFHGHAVSPPEQLSEFEGTSDNGEKVRLSQLRGQVVILTFGYTSCPDVCPTTLSKLRELYQKVAPPEQRLETVFLSVDPNRDTPDDVAKYARAFHPTFVGAVLSEAEVAELRQAYDIEVQKRYSTRKQYEGADEPRENYYIDHTGGYLLVDASGKLRARYPMDVEVAELAPDVTYLLEESAS